jgi:hypothetical protein
MALDFEVHDSAEWIEAVQRIRSLMRAKDSTEWSCDCRA